MSDFPRLTRSRAAPDPGIVHLGLGAFFRSHGALVIEEASRTGGGTWGIVGASLRLPDIRDRLAPQDFAYTAVEMGPTAETRRIADILSDVIFAPESTEVLIERMAHPAIRIVSLTITEKGYCHIPSRGALDVAHPEIRHDATEPVPKTAIGFLVRALARRRDRGLRPFTVLSCDNLPDNGRVCRNVVIGLAELIDRDLAAWIAQEGRFPSSMVDRIVPATTEDAINQLAADTGRYDAAPVFHEPFLQWVIEDDFVDGARPQFDSVPGVQMVSNVAPFEHMKIRMLNGTHSALAYLGYLAGYETISDTVGSPAFQAFVKKLWSDEIIPTLAPPEDVDLHRYAGDLLGRYTNPSIRHRTWQIAMDGSQKLPQRLLGTVADNIRDGRACEGLFLAVAAWMVYVGGVDERGQPIDVRDPLADRLRQLSQQAGSPQETVDALLSVSEVFGPDVDPVLRKGVQIAFECLTANGAEASVRALA